MTTARELEDVKQWILSWTKRFVRFWNFLLIVLTKGRGLQPRTSLLGQRCASTNLHLPPPPHPNLHFTAERERKQSDKIRIVAAGISDYKIFWKRKMRQQTELRAVTNSRSKFGKNVVRKYVRKRLAEHNFCVLYTLLAKKTWSKIAWIKQRLTQPLTTFFEQHSITGEGFLSRWASF